MPSVIDKLRQERRDRDAALSDEERVRLALELGKRDLELFRHSFAPPLTAREARLELERRRQASRVPCRCIEELLK